MQNAIKGMSVIRVLFWLIFLGVVGYLGITISPMYIRHYMLDEALDNLEKEPHIKEMSRREVVDLLHRKLEVNDVRDIHESNIKVTRKEGKTHILVEYEERAHIIGNLYAVGKFKEEETID